MTQRRALLIGASRGLGLGLAEELARCGWQVLATVRGEVPKALAAMEVEHVDITVPEQVAALASRLAGRQFDLLFVIAGVANGAGERIFSTSTEEFQRVMLTNALSPLRVIEAMAGLVAPRGTVAVMTSGLGSVTNNTRGEWEVYRASKAALNTMLRSYAVRAADQRTYLAVAPGWVRTEMGGPNAPLDLATSVQGMAKMFVAREGQGGSAFVNYLNEELPW